MKIAALYKPFFQNSLKNVSIVFGAILFFVFHSSVHAEARSLKDLDNMIQDKDSAIIVDYNGSVLFAKNSNIKLIPASTLKILTSLAALHYLGADYRFVTKFYLGEDSSLKIKGYGDPMLMSEMIKQASDMLVDKLLSEKKGVNDIILDDSYFESPVIIPGVFNSSEPYDALNGALCSNFNTVNFKRTKSGKIVSAEPQTPLLPLALKRIRQLRIDKGRIVFSRKEKENIIYTGHLFDYYLKKRGIFTKGIIKTGLVDINNDRLLLTYASSLSLDQVLSKLLEYSNNFMANQILLATGAFVFGSPATIDKGVSAVSEYARDVLAITDTSLVEGSGISRNNLICATDMMKILEKFSSYRHLMRREKNELYKTGTLKGIFCRAGYIENINKKPCRYVVFINTPGTSIDDIMHIIYQSLEFENKRET